MVDTPYLDKFGEENPEYVAGVLDAYWDIREKSVPDVESDEEKEKQFVAEVEEEKTLFVALRRYGATKSLATMSFEDAGALIHNRSIIERIERRGEEGTEDLVKMLKGAAEEVNTVLKAYIENKQ